MDLEEAIGAHASWRVRFRSAIRNGSPLHVEVIERDDCCEFGQWLYRHGIASFGHLDGFHDCLEKHAVFHLHASKVAHAVIAGEKALAEELLEPGSAYSNAAGEVMAALGRLKWQVMRS